jgi:hypothetical protein
VYGFVVEISVILVDLPSDARDGCGWIAMVSCRRSSARRGGRWERGILLILSNENFERIP